MTDVSFTAENTDLSELKLRPNVRPQNFRFHLDKNTDKEIEDLEIMIDCPDGVSVFFAPRCIKPNDRWEYTPEIHENTSLVIQFECRIPENMDETTDVHFFIDGEKVDTINIPFYQTI